MTEAKANQWQCTWKKKKKKPDLLFRKQKDLVRTAAATLACSKSLLTNPSHFKSLYICFLRAIALC